MLLVGNNSYRTPKDVRIELGASFTDAGLTIKGNGTPTVYIINSTVCTSESNTKNKANNNATSNDKITTTTETTSNNANNKDTTVNAQISTSDNTLIIDPDITAKNMCLSLENATGVIDSHLNTPIKNGEFTFYGIGGRGACGLDTNSV